MAAKRTFHIRVESNLHGLGIVLKSALCEWLLLFLLLLDGAFSYFLTKFAEYCELQLPCILCSRLDHVLGKKEPNFYRNLLCSDHRSEVSSLVLCHNHGKLADVHGMCEECLLSFMAKVSSQEIYNVLLGKMGLDCLQKPLISVDTVLGSLTTSCSCCAKQWRSRPNLQKLVQLKPSGPVSKPEIPLPKSPRRKNLNRQDGLKKRKDRFSMSTAPLLLGCTDYDSLSHVGYTEVKITSDSESDLPVSDDDDMAANVARDLKNIKEDFTHVGCAHKPAHTTSTLMHLDHEPEKGETTTPTFLVPGGDVRDGFRQTNWQKIRNKANPALPEFISLYDIPLSSSAPEVSPVASADEGDRGSLQKKFGASLIFHNNASTSENMQPSKEKWVDTEGNGDIGHSYVMNNWESIDLNSTTTSTGLGTDPLRKEVLSMSNSRSTADTRDLGPGTSKDVQTSGLLEQLCGRDYNGIGPNEEPTTSKTPSALPADSSSCNHSPTMNGHAEVHQMTEAHSSAEFLRPLKLPSMGRSRSLESLEQSCSEVEGENIVDRLKRQVEYDRKCISNLCKELEEERNASAIAANQAMAMITKLQEEKSVLHMEALQYLRMMEEQAEYDMEALEKANDMIAEKEKEIQDLEAELDYFRIKYPEEFPETSDMLGESVDLENVLNSNDESIQFEKS